MPQDDNYFGIEEAIANAGVPSIPADQPAQNSVPAQQPAEAEFVGGDVTEYFGEDENLDAPAPQQTQVTSNITPEMASLLQRNQELLQQTFAAQQKQSADRIAELEARLAAFDNTNPNTPAEKPWYEGLDIPELTPEQRKQYEQSLPIIEAIASRKAIEIARRMEEARIDPMNRRFQEVVQPLQEGLQAQQQAMVNTAQQSFQQTLHSRLPWLREAISTPAYAKYYNEVVPGTGGLTRQVLLEQAEAVGNVEAVVDLLSGFKAPVQQNQQQYAAPGRGYTVNPTQQANAAQPRVKKGMKLSTYDKALKDYSNGKMSSERFKEYQTAWDTALVNGTAVMD